MYLWATEDGMAVILPEVQPEEAQPEATVPLASQRRGIHKKDGEGMTVTFTLEGKLKSGKNHVQITRTGRRYPNKAFAAWRTEMLAGIPKLTRGFIGPVCMICDYVPGDLIRRDAPGMQDAILHLLEKGGIVLDDAQVKEVHWKEFPMDRKRPFCRVTIQDRG